MITTTELKGILEASHKRDIRLIIIGAIIDVIGVLFILSLLVFLRLDFGQMVSNMLGLSSSGALLNGIVIFLIVVAVILYSIRDIFTARNRQRKIDEFVSLVENKSVAFSVTETSTPRIVINLIKIKINLAHVNKVHVTFEGGKKSYALPFPSLLVADLKSMLSGVDNEKVEKAWNELYDDETTSDETESSDYELKTTEEFREFVNSELIDDISDIEKQRAATKRSQLIGIVIALVLGGGFVLFMFFKSNMLSGSNSLYILLALLGSMVYFVYYGFVKKGNVSSEIASTGIRHEFKTKVFNRVISFIDPSLNYVMHGHLSLPEFLDTGFFEEKHYDISGNDQILGKYKGVPFQICDIDVERTRNFSSEKDEPDTVVFGQAFVAKFNKSFCKEVFIIPKKNSFSTSSYLRSLGEKVVLEDPEFMKMFNVYATDQIEARYILSTSLMQRIKDIVKLTKGEIYISFRNNRISMINNSGDNRFEVSLYKSITKEEQVIHFYEELCQQLHVIDDLKLNEKLWA